MSQQFCNYNNQTKTDNKDYSFDRMYISTLLKYTALPTLEEVKKASKDTWQKRTKDPLERSLDDLVDCEILEEWHYKDANGNYIDRKTIDKLTESDELLYNKWKNLRVFFTLKEFEILIELDDALDYKYNELKSINYKFKKKKQA